MKYSNRHLTNALAIIGISLFFSCQNVSEKAALKEIRKLEYSRKDDSNELVPFLNSKNPSVRSSAVQCLGRIQDTSSAVLLSNRLKDVDESVREAAAFALGQLFSPVAEDYLLGAIPSESSESVRLKIIEALGKSGTENSFSVLKDYLESNNSSYEAIASISCGLLAYRDYPPYNNVSVLEGLLTSPEKSDDIKWRAAYGLFRIGNPTSFKNIYEQLNDQENPVMKYFIIKALSAIHTVMKSPEFAAYKSHPKVREALRLGSSSQYYNAIAKALTDSSWYVRVAALELIGLLGNRFSRDEVLRATRDEHPYVRITAIQSLRSFDNSTTRLELRKIFESDPDWRLKGEALLSLAELNISQTLRLIESNLGGLSWPNNYYLIKSLEKIRDDRYQEQTRKLLMTLAVEGEVAQQTLAMEVLVDRNPPIEFMLEKLATADPAITTVVSTHLAYKKAPQAVDPLIDAYKNFVAPKDIEAMTSIIIALDSIKSTRAVAFLEEQLKDPYPSIREHARDALMNITGNESIQMPDVQGGYSTKWDFSLDELLAKSEHPQVEIQTSRGNVRIELFPDKAPVTVANFLSLAQKGFYDGIYFHRVVPAFVVQVGDPRGDGWGGPGYSIPCEYNDIFYERGIVGMAHAGKDTGGSQFFITHLPQPHLNGHYTAFGKVTKGMEVVDNIMMFDKIIHIELLTTEKLASK
jgi:cyclophilin family peptidyl-prolyl cis-trans isomerase